MKPAAILSFAASVMCAYGASAADLPAIDGPLEAAKRLYDQEAGRIDAALAQAEKEADEQKAKARQKLLKAYEEAIKRTTQRGDLVTANAMLEEKSEIEDNLDRVGGRGEQIKNVKMMQIPIATWRANAAGWKPLAGIAESNFPLVIDANLDTQQDFPPGRDLEISIKRPIAASAVLIVTRDKGSYQDIFTKARLIINDAAYEVFDLPQQTCLVVALPRKIRISKIGWITEQQKLGPGIREVMFQ